MGDVNRDFDETLLGQWEWDVKRLVASLAVAGRDNGFTPDRCERVARTCARAYRESMGTFAAMRELDMWYVHTAIDEALEASVDPTYAKAIHRTGQGACARPPWCGVEADAAGGRRPPADQRSAIARPPALQNFVSNNLFRAEDTRRRANGSVLERHDIPSALQATPPTGRGTI